MGIMNNSTGNERYTSPQRREQLNKLIEIHGEDTVINVMDWKKETLSSYSHNGPRDISEQKLELLEMRLSKL